MRRSRVRCAVAGWGGVANDAAARAREEMEMDGVDDRPGGFGEVLARPDRDCPDVREGRRSGDDVPPEWAERLLRERAERSGYDYLAGFFGMESGRYFGAIYFPTGPEPRYYQVTPDGLAPLDDIPAETVYILGLVVPD